jgi:hypothetical protein
MKAAIFALALLVALDGALYFALRRLSTERTELALRRDELSREAKARRESGERGRKTEALLQDGSRSMGGVDGALDIAALRDLLSRAERGLDIDRFSLDFRPAQDAPKGGEGGRISANLGGSFDSVYEYLARVEDLRLPLAPDAVTLRREESGRILLAIEWNALWGEESPALEALSPSDVADLEKWLRREAAPPPSRNLFSEAAPPAEASLNPELPAPPEPSLPELVSEVEPSSPPLRLTGFVIARPELEPDVNRRVLAALRFEGELRLVGVGDVIGSYRVEEVDARERVLLVHQETGERMELLLE